MCKEPLARDRIGCLHGCRCLRLYISKCRSVCLYVFIHTDICTYRSIHVCRCRGVYTCIYMCMCRELVKVSHVCLFVEGMNARGSMMGLRWSEKDVSFLCEDDGFRIFLVCMHACVLSVPPLSSPVEDGRLKSFWLDCLLKATATTRERGRQTDVCLSVSLRTPLREFLLHLLNTFHGGDNPRPPKTAEHNTHDR